METDLEKITKNIQKKLGKENSAMITDDLASIITIKSNYENKIKQDEEEINQIKQDKEVLIQANGNLLQQVSMSAEPKKEEPKKEEPKNNAMNFNFSAMFDEKGNFIK